MKITIKVTPEALFLLHGVINNMRQKIAKSREERVRLSIIQELFQILTSRCIAYTNNTNGKPRTLTLKYYQADCLCRVLCCFSQKLGIYEQNKIDLIKNELHQKLM